MILSSNTEILAYSMPLQTLNHPPWLHLFKYMSFLSQHTLVFWKARTLTVFPHKTPQGACLE